MFAMSIKMRKPLHLQPYGNDLTQFNRQMTMFMHTDSKQMQSNPNHQMEHHRHPLFPWTIANGIKGTTKRSNTKKLHKSFPHFQIVKNIIIRNAHLNIQHMSDSNGRWKTKRMRNAYRCRRLREVWWGNRNPLEL